MQLISEENIKISNSTFSVEDALKNNTNVSIKIEAAHAGVMNGNYLFYLPKALASGANSLNKFYKPLQKKHYSKTLGYIYESKYIETDISSSYYNDIINSKNKKDLVSNVKKYIKTKEYEKNKTGFVVLVSKAKLHDINKIHELQDNGVGTVSVAGDALDAYCSICVKHIAECGHKLGQRYGNNELCFGVITDNFEVDHISFETIPANWETNSLIITDSQVLGNIELIEEGQLMKLSLDALKEKLGNIESVLAELNLSEFLSQYKTDIENALNSQFLLSADKCLPYNTPLTTYVTNELLSQLEDSEDKNSLIEIFGTTYADIFADKTEEEIKNILANVEVSSVTLEPTTEPVEQTAEQPTTEAPLTITDSNKLVLEVVDSLTAVFDSSFQNILMQLKDYVSQQEKVKSNKIYEDRIAAFKQDLTSAGTLNKLVTDELKQSLLNQIALLTKVDTNSEYFLKLKDRTVQELKMTLEDHANLTFTTPVVAKEETPLKVEDSLKEPVPTAKIDPTQAASEMNEPVDLVLEVTDADKYIETVIAGVEGKLNRAEFSALYKKTVFDQGSKVAKKLHSALKAQNKI